MSLRIAIHPFKLTSILLQYPTPALFQGLGALDAAAAALRPRGVARRLAGFLAWLRAAGPTESAQHYVETFDLRRRSTLYLTYHRHGDTRRRGMAMLAFKEAYRAEGLEATNDELPDYLPMVLEFASTSPRGERLLADHRADLELLRRALCEAKSPYAGVVDAVCARLPAPRRRELALVRDLWEGGPPSEDVGVEPFAPPDYLQDPRLIAAEDTTMSAWTGLWWIVLPYVSMAIFVLGHVWRWRYDQFGWSSYSTELQEHSWLKWGSPLFHYGAFAAIVGHGLGLLVPLSWTKGIGIPDHAYHLFAAWAGAAAAAAVLVGMAMLAGRRILSPRVRATTIPVDWVALIALGIVVVLGITTTSRNLIVAPYNYRETISLWFRGLFWAHPHAALAEGAPLVYRVHAIAAWFLLALWPFTRLVHVWSVPVGYLWRPLIPYRKRAAAPPNEPGTANRKWRKYGVRY